MYKTVLNTHGHAHTQYKQASLTESLRQIDDYNKNSGRQTKIGPSLLEVLTIGNRVHALSGSRWHLAEHSFCTCNKCKSEKGLQAFKEKKKKVHARNHHKTVESNGNAQHEKVPCTKWSEDDGTTQNQSTYCAFFTLHIKQNCMWGCCWKLIFPFEKSKEALLAKWSIR